MHQQGCILDDPIRQLLTPQILTSVPTLVTVNTTRCRSVIRSVRLAKQPCIIWMKTPSRILVEDSRECLQRRFDEFLLGRGDQGDPQGLHTQHA